MYYILELKIPMGNGLSPVLTLFIKEFFQPAQRQILCMLNTIWMKIRERKCNSGSNYSR